MSFFKLFESNKTKANGRYSAGLGKVVTLSGKQTAEVKREKSEVKEKKEKRDLLLPFFKSPDKQIFFFGFKLAMRWKI